MRGLCHFCLTSNVELEIHKKRISCINCVEQKAVKVRSPRVVIDEFPELKILTKEKRRESSDNFTQKVFDEMKNSLIHGVPE